MKYLRLAVVGGFKASIQFTSIQEMSAQFMKFGVTDRVTEKENTLNRTRAVGRILAIW